MITEEKLKVFKYFNGDIDRWARGASDAQKSIIKNEDWSMINGLIQDLIISNNGLASADFTNALNDRLESNCIDDLTQAIIKALAEERK